MRNGQSVVGSLFFICGGITQIGDLKNRKFTQIGEIQKIKSKIAL
jgi:hypothetical protein